MKSSKRITCRQCSMLALAFLACVLQVLALFLPSLVVCYRTDRPPQVEYFSASCSCRQEFLHSGCAHDGSGVPFMEESCTDLHLDSHAAITAATCRHLTPIDNTQRVRAADCSVFGSASLQLRLASDGRGIPKMEAPPLFAPAAGFRLRC